MGAIFGLIFHSLGGFASGSFYIPYRKIQVWSWESAWIVGGVFSWILVPFLAAYMTIPDFMQIIQKTENDILFWTYGFGVLWGIGGLTFGLAMRYLGMSLGMSIALSLCSIFGSLVPPIYREIMGVQGDTTGWIAYELNNILHHAGLTYLQFLEMCVLMGSDYTNKAKSLPFKQSYFTIKYKGNLHKALESIHITDIVPYDRAIDMLNGRGETAEALMSEKQWMKWSLWKKGDKDAISTETPYLDELRTNHLKDMDADEFGKLFQSDILVL
jgi:hypothetical protein